MCLYRNNYAEYTVHSKVHVSSLSLLDTGLHHFLVGCTTQDYTLLDDPKKVAILCWGSTSGERWLQCSTHPITMPILMSYLFRCSLAGPLLLWACLHFLPFSCTVSTSTRKPVPLEFQHAISMVSYFFVLLFSGVQSSFKRIAFCILSVTTSYLIMKKLNRPSTLTM